MELLQCNEIEGIRSGVVGKSSVLDAGKVNQSALDRWAVSELQQFRHWSRPVQRTSYNDV